MFHVKHHRPRATDKVGKPLPVSISHFRSGERRWQLIMLLKGELRKYIVARLPAGLHGFSSHFASSV